MRIGPQTRASYVKNLRCHIEGYPIADVTLAQLTGQRLTAHYRVLEKSGRKDHKAGEGLSPQTVRYVHTIIHGVLGQAVKDGLVLRNAADAATPPTAREAKTPEMHPWDAGQLAAFLGWAKGNAQNYALWNTLAMTGMRRGELLALRWRDVDLEAATVSVRRSAGMVRIAGEGAEMVEGGTKSGKPRVVDLDHHAAMMLRAHKRERGALALHAISGRDGPPDAGRVVWRNCAAVGQEPARVVEEDDAVAQQAPPLLGVEGDGVGRVAVRAVSWRARGSVRTHGEPLDQELRRYVDGGPLLARSRAVLVTAPAKTVGVGRWPAPAGAWLAAAWPGPRWRGPAAPRRQAS